jgi:hypothetical protein
MASRSAIEASPWWASVRALPRRSRRAGFWAIAFSFLLLGALPLNAWMEITVTPLEPHPNDPVHIEDEVVTAS